MEAGTSTGSRWIASGRPAGAPARLTTGLQPPRSGSLARRPGAGVRRLLRLRQHLVAAHPGGRSGHLGRGHPAHDWPPVDRGAGPVARRALARVRLRPRRAPGHLPHPAVRRRPAAAVGRFGRRLHAGVVARRARAGLLRLPQRAPPLVRDAGGRRLGQRRRARLGQSALSRMVARRPPPGLPLRSHRPVRALRGGA